MSETIENSEYNLHFRVNDKEVILVDNRGFHSLWVRGESQLVIDGLGYEKFAELTVEEVYKMEEHLPPFAD